MKQVYWSVSVPVNVAAPAQDPAGTVTEMAGRVCPPLLSRPETVAPVAVALARV